MSAVWLVARDGLPWHERTRDDVCAALETTPDGLPRDEAAKRRDRIGPNRLTPPDRDGLVEELVESLTEPLQLLLIAVAVLSGIWGELRDAIAIGVIIVIVATIETMSELRARRALDSLRDLTRPESRILSDGLPLMVDSHDLVPGDVLVLDAGDQVPADARVIVSGGLRADESAMTGEPVPVDKTSEVLPAGTPLAERSNLVFAGTGIVGGSGRAVVVATGQATELGDLGRLVAAAHEPETPLAQTMRRLANVILVAAAAVSVGIPLIGVLRGQPVREMVLAGLALAFATVPEELPILVTVLLAVGGRRLARDNILLRRLRAGETIGEVTVVVTDKTGTLTATS